MELFPLIRLLLFTFIAFGLAIVATPVLTHFLYKYKLWKPKVRQFGPDGDAVPIIANLQSQQDSGTPRMGGLLIWLTVVVVAAVGFFISKLDDSFSFWNLLNRSETWLPMFTLVAAGIIGFVTNAGFLEANTADGLRKSLADEFSSLYVFHLRGNQRTSGETSRKEGGKIFQTFLSEIQNFKTS